MGRSRLRASVFFPIDRSTDLCETVGQNMGRGRAPCCEKVGLKKGPWTPAEDMRLMAYIHKYGHGNWRALPKQAGLLRCGKSCRLRWINYLRPDVKRGNFTPEEEETIIKLHELMGNKWSKIASRLPGRTDNEIKNVWNTHLKKRLVSKGSNPSVHTPKESSTSSSSNSSTDESRGMAYEGKENAAFDSQTPSEVWDAVEIENKEEKMEETIEIPIEQSFWDMLEDDPTHLKEEADENRAKRMVNTPLKKKLELDEPNLSLDGPKESSSASSSSSTSSCLSFSNPVDGRGLEEQAQPPFFAGRIDDFNGREEKEINQDQYREATKTSLDSNLDFWDIIDEDMCFFPSNVGPIDDQGVHQQTRLEEESKEIDGRIWIEYLENELGLWTPSNEDQPSLMKSAVEPLVSYPTDDGKLDIEIDPVFAYFQTGPSSPPIFSL